MAAPVMPAPAADGGPPAAPAAGDRIERAVAFINAHADVIENEIIAIGDYLLREFFDDDPRKVASRSPAKVNSLRDLAARKDLRLSYRTLWRAVHLAIQERQLGTDPRADQLSTAQRAELLAVRDLAVKRRLAQTAVEAGWSRDELRDAIGRQGRRWQRLGERAALAGALRVLRRAATALRGLAERPEELVELPAADEQELLALLDKAIGAFEAALAAAPRSRRAERRRRRG